MGSKDESPESGERRDERMPLHEATRLRPNDWSSMEVRMIDLSCSGFRAYCDARLQRGSCVSLDVAGIGSVDAQVEWQHGEMFGARFFQPIDLASCYWTPVERETVLAWLLIERAAAQRAGQTEVEQELRRQILTSLPIRKGAARL